MSESPKSNEAQNQTIVLENGVLQPMEYRWKEGDGYEYSYTVRGPAPEIGGDYFKKATYYLKPDSKDSQKGQVHGIVDVWYYVEDLYVRRGQETLPGQVTYQLEQKNSEDGTPTTSLILNSPKEIKQEATENTEIK